MECNRLGSTGEAFRMTSGPILDAIRYTDVSLNGYRSGGHCCDSNSTRPFIETNAGRRKTGSHLEPKWTRKNIVIHQRKLDLAKTLLQAPTETATVDQALDLIAFQKEVFAGIDRMVELGGIEAFDDR